MRVAVTASNAGGASAPATSARTAVVQAESAKTPIVAGVKPKEGPRTGGTSVAITGAHFLGAGSVRFGSLEAVTFTLQSATSIVAKSPPGSGTVDVTVTTPEGTSGTSSVDQFRYLPALLEVSPTSGPVGGGTTVMIRGAGFIGTTAVEFGTTEVDGFTVNSESSITAISPAGPAGTVDVRVSGPEGTSPISSKDRFQFTPTITGLTPRTGPDAGGTSVIVNGSGFVPGTTATIFRFGTASATSVNCSSSTECTTVSPAHAKGTVAVKATVNKATSPKTSADQFTYG